MNIIRPFVVECARIYETVNSDNTASLSGKKRNIAVVIDNTINNISKKPRYK
jgi:hypothetical protein